MPFVITRYTHTYTHAHTYTHTYTHTYIYNINIDESLTYYLL